MFLLIQTTHTVFAVNEIIMTWLVALQENKQTNKQEIRLKVTVLCVLPLVSVSRQSPWELNHLMLGSGSPVTLQSISAQLPSRAIIWLTFVNTTGTNPLSVTVPFSVRFLSVSTDKALAVWEAIRDTRTRNTHPPVQCIFSDCRCITQRRGNSVIPPGSPSCRLAISW